MDFILSHWWVLSKGITRSDLHCTRITLAAVGRTGKRGPEWRHAEHWGGCCSCPGERGGWPDLGWEPQWWGEASRFRMPFVCSQWDLPGRTSGITGAQSHPVLILARHSGGTDHHSQISPYPGLRCSNHMFLMFWHLGSWWPCRDSRSQN